MSKCYSDTIKDSSVVMDVFYNQNPLIEDNDVLTHNATALLDWLVNDAKSNPYQDTEKVLVHNLYNSGYHTERKPIKYSCVYKKFDIKTGKQIVE
jgi:hypothetical protein